MPQIERQRGAHVGVAVFPGTERGDRLLHGDKSVPQQLVRVKMLLARGGQVLREITVDMIFEQGGVGAAGAQMDDAARAEARLLQQLPFRRLLGSLAGVDHPRGEFRGEVTSSAPFISRSAC